MRLDKLLCKSTELTKPEAIQCIHAGDVLVNGMLAVNEAMQVHENNVVLLNGVKLVPRAFRYLLLHKPANTVCSNIDEAYPSVFHCLDIDKVSELHIAGRLDADTTGLVLITDDGRWSFHITSPKNACRKVYRVGLSRAMSNDAAADISEKFAKGIQLQGEDKLTLPADLEILTPKEVLLTITEGRFHQVKRMFAAVGNRVVSLHREQIGDVYLDVEVGQWRYLTEPEIASLGKYSVDK
ncbi:pseudouridine synthase [Marinomonas sp. C2222]|uniref:Pseudouridine synthase n=1 Tax=Marinomonas sargassi TaxID=2984494 RepID=A0ABT2YRJ3_9GAMM|nr:pseudouridine synthase [Marinomonas sargassi]MCV2402514.1 pseudouridine synthase [Marinomonas sargassi]